MHLMTYEPDFVLILTLVHDYIDAFLCNFRPASSPAAS